MSKNEPNTKQSIKKMKRKFDKPYLGERLLSEIKFLEEYDHEDADLALGFGYTKEKVKEKLDVNNSMYSINLTSYTTGYEMALEDFNDKRHQNG